MYLYDLIFGNKKKERNNRKYLDIIYMPEIIDIALNGYNKCKTYLESADLVIYVILTIIVLYFLMYLVSFFFKLPVIILIGLLIGYFLYKQKKTNAKII